jgi:hypothetical protein
MYVAHHRLARNQLHIDVLNVICKSMISGKMPVLLNQVFLNYYAAEVFCIVCATISVKLLSNAGAKNKCTCFAQTFGN